MTVIGDELVLAFQGGGHNDAVGGVIVKVGQGDRTSSDCAVNRDFHEPCVQKVLPPLHRVHVEDETALCQQQGDFPDGDCRESRLPAFGRLSYSALGH